MTLPIFFCLAIDSIYDTNYKNAFYMIAICGLIATFIRVFEVLNTYTWHKMYNKMFDIFTKLGSRKTYDNSIYSLSRFSMGEYLNIMTSDINIICDTYCNLIMRLIRTLEIAIIFFYFFTINIFFGFTVCLVLL